MKTLEKIYTTFMSSARAVKVITENITTKRPALSNGAPLRNLITMQKQADTTRIFNRIFVLFAYRTPEYVISLYMKYIFASCCFVHTK